MVFTDIVACPSLWPGMVMRVAVLGSWNGEDSYVGAKVQIDGG